MPAWLIGWIISIAVKLGLAWLVKRFPNLPPGIVVIIEDLLNNLKNPEVDKKEAKKAARQAIKEHCSGVGCPPEIKGEP